MGQVAIWRPFDCCLASSSRECAARTARCAVPIGVHMLPRNSERSPLLCIALIRSCPVVFRDALAVSVVEPFIGRAHGRTASVRTRGESRFRLASCVAPPRVHEDRNFLVHLASTPSSVSSSSSSSLSVTFMDWGWEGWGRGAEGVKEGIAPFAATPPLRDRMALYSGRGGSPVSGLY